MGKVWGNRFHFGSMGLELVPLAIYTTAEQRTALKIDEATYQEMLKAAKATNPGLEGDPLFVGAEDGELASIGGYFTYSEVIQAGIDVGSRAKGTPLPYILYQEECERRDLETLSGCDVKLPLSRSMTLRELIDDALDMAVHYLKCCERDGEMSEKQLDAAVRQVAREAFEITSNGSATMPLQDLVKHARDWDEIGRYAAVTITPDDVRDRIGDEGSFPQYAGVDFEQVAENACENFPESCMWPVSDLIYDQIVAEADALAEMRSPVETFMNRIAVMATPLEVLNSLDGHAPLTTTDAGLFSREELEDLMAEREAALDLDAINDAVAEATSQGVSDPVFQLGEFGGCTVLDKPGVARALGFDSAELRGPAPAWLVEHGGNPPLSTSAHAPAVKDPGDEVPDREAGEWR